MDIAEKLVNDNKWKTFYLTYLKSLGIIVIDVNTSEV